MTYLQELEFKVKLHKKEVCNLNEEILLLDAVKNDNEFKLMLLEKRFITAIKNDKIIILNQAIEIEKSKIQKLDNKGGNNNAK